MRPRALPTLSKHACAMILVIALAALLSGTGIAQHVFWDDEANTAVIARNLLRTGTLTGWDGANLMAFRGGEDLDETLIQKTVPPLQYYVAAAGLAAFGESVWGARLPFLVLGLGALWFLGRWAAAQLGPRFPAWLPPLLLALDAPYLLYIRQARYYALTLFCFAMLGWAWSGLGQSRMRLWLGAAAALALFYSNYLCGLAAIAALAAFFAEPRWRDRAHLKFFALIAGLVGGAAVLVVARRHDAVPHHLASALQLLWWELRGLGEFELAPILILPLVALPFLVERLKPWRALAAASAAPALAMLLFLMTVAIASPQPLDVTERADMRYVLPAMLLGSLAAAGALVILAASFGRVAAGAGFALVMLTNAAYPGFESFRCTLCEFARETVWPHPSGEDALVAFARSLPAGTLVHAMPATMTDALIFAAPQLRYGDRLDRGKVIDAAVRVRLPAYIFVGAVPPEVLVQAVGASPLLPGMILSVSDRAYRVDHLISILWFDGTRPDLPLHRFRADPAANAAHGIAILRPGNAAAIEQAQTN
jgi:hypothetical protein